MEIKLNKIKYKNIFEKLNIQINDSTLTGIIGKNGSGKSTLLNIIYGLYNNFEGEVYIDKEVINKSNIKDKIQNIRKDIFYLKQEYQDSLFCINVLEDIKYSIPKIDLEKLNDLLKMFDLDEKILKKNYLDLSNSEIKRILIIKMFLKDYKIILLDDPTSDLNQKSISNLIKLLKREKYNDKLVLISSTDSEFLLKTCDNYIIIDGKKVYLKNGKYSVFNDATLLNRINLSMPSVLAFKLYVDNKKKIKLVYRDNINDLIKDIYRNVKRK